MGYKAYKQNFRVIGRYLGGRRFPSHGGNGGEFRKSDRTRPLIMCQKTCIPSFETIWLNFKIFEFSGESPPLGGEWRRISEIWKRNSLSNGVQSIHTEIEGNRTIFQDGGFRWGGNSPPGGRRGGFSGWPNIQIASKYACLQLCQIWCLYHKMHNRLAMRPH